MQDSGGYRNSSRGNFNSQNRGGANPSSWISGNPIKSIWITNGADESMIEFSDEAGKYMADNKLTNSKIRSIYGEIKRIQMGEFKKEKASFFLLRPKVAYAFGREPQNKGLELFKLIFDEVSKHVTDQKSYINFCNFFESILAFHKAYGGKD